MRYLNMSSLGYVFLMAFVVLSFSFAANAEEEVHDDDIIVGNVICLLPNVADGTV